MVKVGSELAALAAAMKLSTKRWTRFVQIRANRLTQKC